ncbi:MAG: AMP-binding protein [Acidobacteriota bacterium]
MTNFDENAIFGFTTIKELIENSINRYPGEPALSFFDSEPVTYGEMGIKIKELSQLLRDHGIRKGDKVAILGENSPNWGISYLSIVTMGAVAVPVLPDFQQSDLENILNHSESKLLFATKKQFEKIRYEKCGNISRVIILDDLRVEETGFDTVGFSDFVNDALKKISAMIHDIGEFTGLISAEVSKDDLAAIIYTSGTTGLSKGVMLSHGNIVANVLAMKELIGFDQNDRFLSLLPLSHALECTIGFLLPMSSGASSWYTGSVPTPPVIKKAASIVKPTCIPLVPLIIEKIYKKRVQSLLEKNFLTKAVAKTPFLKKKLYKKAGKAILDFFGGEVRMIAIGGAPLGSEVENFLRIAEFPYVMGYGLTETAPLLTGERVSETRKGSSGYPIKDVEIKIIDPDPKTGIGEIYAKGPNVMSGYFKNESITKEVLSDDGWFKTGDKGYMDKDNYLYIRGRSKNMFLGPNGENIYPEVIEEKLNEILVVQESLAIENKGDVEALIYLDHDILSPKLEGKSEKDQKKIIDEMLENIRIEVNDKLPPSSRIKRAFHQSEEFTKTATKKIKRYLYYHPASE